jgi:hypothetical protein
MTTLRQPRFDADLASTAWSLVDARRPQGADAEELP